MSQKNLEDIANSIILSLAEQGLTCKESIKVVQIVNGEIRKNRAILFKKTEETSLKVALREAEQKTKVPISAKEILAGFVDKAVPLFIETAIEALSLPDGEGVEFAAIVLNDALKYDSVYPYDRFSHADDSMYKAVEKIRDRLTIEDTHR